MMQYTWNCTKGETDFLIKRKTAWSMHCKMAMLLVLMASLNMGAVDAYHGGTCKSFWLMKCWITAFDHLRMTKIIKKDYHWFFLFQVLTLGRSPVHLYANLPGSRIFQSSQSSGIGKYLLLSAIDDIKKVQRKQDIPYMDDLTENVSPTFKGSNNLKNNSKRRAICLYSYKPGCIHIIPGY